MGMIRPLLVQWFVLSILSPAEPPLQGVKPCLAVKNKKSKLNNNNNKRNTEIIKKLAYFPKYTVTLETRNDFSFVFFPLFLFQILYLQFEHSKLKSMDLETCMIYPSKILLSELIHTGF